MRETFLSFSPPTVGEQEISAVSEVLRTAWITTGPRTAQFEREFAAFLGASGALALNSCTAALHTALVTLGIGPGDEVITTPMTFAASVNVIEHVGARPVLVDVQPDTLNIDPARIEPALTQRTRAILPVHYAGHPVDLDSIDELARIHRLVVLEDAAHALPSRYRGRHIGTGDRLVAFSFYATKNLTTAEGGMLTGPRDWLEQAKVISLHGMSRDAWKRYEKGGNWFYEVVTPGFKYNMTDIQAALGLVQLHRLSGFQARRRAIVAQYQEAFSRSDVLQCPTERSDVESAWHLYVLRLRTETLRISRDSFIQELAKRNIGTSVHFIPIHAHPYYREKYGWKPMDFPVAYGNYERLVSLPLHPGLTDRDIQDIVEAVWDVADCFKR
ncbi:MAG: DegT/DnrJ/EryC1/StrS family aminotransferase [Gammaproteobacteria bacterium]